MILPIFGYGFPVLKKVAEVVPEDYPNLSELIENMMETMYSASGVGLAAPQIGLSLRLFVVDTKQVMEEGKEEEGYRQAFLNAQILEDAGEPWAYEEGCLSIPDIRGDVDRPQQIRMRYQDENFQTHETVFTGMNARVIQHEYDHIEGILFTEHLKPIKKRLIKRKLENIRKGNVSADYRMKFYGK